MSGVNYTFSMSTLFGASYFLLGPVLFPGRKGGECYHEWRSYSGHNINPVVVSYIGINVGTLGMYIGIDEGFIQAEILGMGLVSRLGYVPGMTLSSATLTTNGSNPYFLFKPGSSTGEWVRFQVITSIGRGIGLQL